MANPDRTYSVLVKATTTRAVLISIVDTGIQMWVPRSQVVFPAGVERGDELDVIIPGWLIRSEIGEPDF
jgi:hypothetical protein